MDPEEDHYSLLKIGRNATSDQIRKAYFHAARLLHPDTNPDPDAAEQFIKLQQAYETLSDANRRVAYDLTLGEEETFDPGVSVNATYSRQELPHSSESQLVYVLFEVLSTVQSNEGLSVPLNLSLVIDRSTSMGGERMDNVKQNALNLVHQMKADNFLSVVSFSDRAELLVPATRLTDISKIESNIRLMQPGGATEIYQGLEMGLSQIRRNLNPRYINHLIMITDGHTYGDEAACLDLAERAAAEGIGISGIGIGSEWNDGFIDKMVSFGGGNSLFASSPKDLDNFFADKLKNLVNVYAEGVTWDFDCDDEVELRYAFRVKPDQSPLTISRSICLGSILSSSGLNIILEFVVHPLPKRVTEVTLAHGKLKMNIPSRLKSSSSVSVNLSRAVNDQVTDNTTNAAVIQALSQLSLYRMQEKARHEASTGDIVRATTHLQNLATHLLSLDERDLARTVLMEADHLLKKKSYTGEGDKKIKYGTRALCLLPGGASEPA